jgi:hypothetical protein
MLEQSVYDKLHFLPALTQLKSDVIMFLIVIM